MKRSINLLFAFVFMLTEVPAQTNAPYTSVTQLASQSIFPPAPDVRWYTEGKLDKMVFYRDSTTIHVYMNRKGRVVTVTRYYTDVNELPVFVLARLIERFPGYSPFAVTEEQDDAGLNYLINIGNSSNWMQLHSDVNGRFTILAKYQHPRILKEEAQIPTLP